MAPDHNEKCSWGPRHIYLMVLLCQMMGSNAFILLPDLAVSHGATGYITGYVIVYIVFGIPLLYMEFIVSQFTARDCLQVWKIRACFSHFGYFHVLWQIIILIYNHVVTAFILHYFLISFEDPIPYYMCGHWATKNCNIIANNYTVNQDCLKAQETFSHCEDLYMAFPECQYWRYHILGVRSPGFHVAWRVCLASGLEGIILFLSCFKKKLSVKWFIGSLTIYPLIGYVVIMIGSMMQKGLVVMYEEALDSNFALFSEKYRISNIILYVIYTLNIGTGISFNLAASTSFRAPCYSNIVVTVIICAAFTVVTVNTFAMMACPYAYEYGIRPYNILKFPIDLVFEKTPRLVYEFEHKTIWLILIFSCNVMVGLSTNVIIFISLLEMVAQRNAKLANYPGLTTFVGVSILYFITIPLLGPAGIDLLVEFRRFFNFMTIFFSIIECVVFVLWYGVEKFSEDVHFMQGIQPKKYLKIAWICSPIVLTYVFCIELYYQLLTGLTFGEKLGLWTLVTIIGVTILMIIIKLLVAVCRLKIQEAIRLDPNWGPRSDILLRSRAMFTAQAMTKEYLYRQYHLQAGIISRQKKFNIRKHQDV